MLDNGQTETITTLVPTSPFVHPVEPLEYPSKALGRNSRAVVPYCHHHPLRFRHGGDFYQPPSRGVLESVILVVDEDLLVAAGFDEHRR